MPLMTPNNRTPVGDVLTAEIPVIVEFPRSLYVIVQVGTVRYLVVIVEPLGIVTKPVYGPAPEPPVMVNVHGPETVSLTFPRTPAGQVPPAPPPEKAGVKLTNGPEADETPM